jgi:CTP:molybdopterin cytidylyltransferase MocA
MPISTALPAVVIAAGESRRMGRLKPLLPLGSRTVLQRAVDGLLSAEVSPLFVVVGHRAEEVTACIADRPVIITANPRYSGGMLSSIQWGIRQLPHEVPAFLLALGDQPDIRPEVVQSLREEWEARPGSIVVPVVGGKRGHPVLFDSRYLPEILSLREPQTLRDVVHSPEAVRREVAVSSDGPLLDLDTPEDYEAALRSGRFTD